MGARRQRRAARDEGRRYPRRIHQTEKTTRIRLPATERNSMPCVCEACARAERSGHRSAVRRCHHLVQRGYGVRAAALLHDVPRAAFAPAALGGNAQLELDVVEAEPRAHMADDFAVGDPVAYADDHDDEARGGRLLRTAPV